MELFLRYFVILGIFHTVYSDQSDKQSKERGVFLPRSQPTDVATGVPRILTNRNLPAQKPVTNPQQLPSPQKPVRFVHPTRMPLQAHQTPPQRPQTLQDSRKIVASTPKTPFQEPKILMKHFVPNNNPTLSLKTRDQALPDIHKMQRFTPATIQRPLFQPFDTNQHLPIKKAFETNPLLAPHHPQLTIANAHTKDFYHTKEFQDFLKEFNLKVEVKKLPPIDDVMAVLGTDNAADTLDSILKVARSEEGMVLIRSYLDQEDSQVDDDKFYNYDDDTGAGEIQIGGTRGYQETSSSIYSIPKPSAVPPPAIFPHMNLRAPPTEAQTVGSSWWKPASWFSSSPTEKVPEEAKNGSSWNMRKYFSSAPQNDQRANINTPTRRIFTQPPQTLPQGRYPTLPTVRLTEEQFRDLVLKLRLAPVFKQPLNVKQPIDIKSAPKPQVFVPQTTEQPTTVKPHLEIQQQKFQSPINVQPSNQIVGIPLPATIDQAYRRESGPIFNRIGMESQNRRSFTSPSAPERAAPYDFIATGEIYQAEPEEVLRRSKFLAETVEGEKAFIGAIASLTESHQKFQEKIDVE